MFFLVRDFVRNLVVQQIQVILSVIKKMLQKLHLFCPVEYRNLFTIVGASNLLHMPLQD